MGYMGMCRCEGYGFQTVYSRIGHINQSVWVQNRVSLFRKLISWLKILFRLGKPLLQDRGILGVYSIIGQQNSAELALVQVKGSRVPAAHPHPEIPKVPPRGQMPPQNPSTVKDYSSFLLLFFIFNKKILSIKKPERNIFNAINFIVKLDQVLIFNYHSFVNLCKKKSRSSLHIFSVLQSNPCMLRVFFFSMIYFRKLLIAGTF